MASKSGGELDLSGALDIVPLIQPKSIGVVGVSATSQGAAGNAVIANLERFKYLGDIHPVSRGRTEVNGRPCVPVIQELPFDLDTVILGIPGDVVVEAVAACAGRRARSVVIFAAGFAEAGEEGIKAQSEIKRISVESGMPVLGPNCLGLTNFVDGVPLTFGPAFFSDSGTTPALAVLAQSGGMMGNLRMASFARGVKLSHAISTGNESVVGIEDFLNFLISDPKTSAIAMFIEQVRRPKLFLELLGQAREKGKPVIILHPGRSQRAQDSAASHTGALASDYAVMCTLVRAAGAIIVDTIEELVDTAWLLSKWPATPITGVGIVTDSGAFKGFALDFAESVGLPLPDLAAETCDALVPVLPAFSTASNPLDVTAQGLREMSLYGDAAKGLLADPAVNTLAIVVMPGSPESGLAKFRSMKPVLDTANRPVTYTMLGGDSPLDAALVQEVRDSGLPFFRSPERAMRAMARAAEYGRANVLRAPVPTISVPLIEGVGTVPEYRGKAWLAELGLRVPTGQLARNGDEAVAVARRVGYPVVLKAQAADLPHKSDAGGVIVGIVDESGLREGWRRMEADVRRARPDLVLDGILVEAMAPSGGIEMIVGARRDPQWGPVLMVGMGGIWIEALNDVRLLPTDASLATIIDVISQLRGAALLNGARGRGPTDIQALAETVERLGVAVAAQPNIQEIDINPLLVYPKGQGVLALDALVALS